MLDRASRSGICLFMDSNSYPDPYGRYECLFGAGVAEALPDVGSAPFEAVRAAHATDPDWIFLQLCYDLKNVLEPSLSSRHPVRLGFAQLKAFRPLIVGYILRGNSELVVESAGPDAARRR